MKIKSIPQEVEGIEITLDAEEAHKLLDELRAIRFVFEEQPTLWQIWDDISKIL